VRQALEQGIRVNPLFHAYLRLPILNKTALLKLRPREVEEREWVLAINTNGDVYSVADCYNAEFKYGNLFTQTLEDVLSSQGRQNRVKRSGERMRRICRRCALFKKTCGGVFVSHATPEEYRDYESKQECYQSYLTRMMMEESARMTPEEPRSSAHGG
jgi:radical SAM protein with 4Fe4S-binding SPASM domain